MGQPADWPSIAPWLNQAVMLPRVDSLLRDGLNSSCSSFHYFRGPLAFSTIQGSGGAPDSFVGTSGVDTITLINSTGNFFLGAQEDNDFVSFTATALEPAVITGSTIRGGSGDDTLLGFVGIAGFFNGVFVNGNAGNDQLNFATTSLSGSTVQGGQGSDTITIGGFGTTFTSSLVNGNKDNDSITIGSISNNSSIFGGQGNDSINITASLNGSIVNGDNDNDTINVTPGATSVAGSTILGGDGNDTITTALATVAVGTPGLLIDGGAGNDSITGTITSDTIVGGVGNDSIASSGGLDVITGGVGFDQITLTGFVSAVVTNSETLVYGSAQDGGDTLLGAGFTTGALALGGDVIRLLVAGFAGSPAAGTAAVITNAAGLVAANNNGQTVVADTTAALGGIAAGITNRRFFANITTNTFMYDADGNFATAADRITLFTDTSGVGGLVGLAAANISFA